MAPVIHPLAGDLERSRQPPHPVLPLQDDHPEVPRGKPESGAESCWTSPEDYEFG